MLKSRVLAAATAGVFFPLMATADVDPGVKLISFAGGGGDGFGQTVAWAGDTLAVGAPFDDSAAADAGAVHLYRSVDGVWTHVGSLLPNPPQADQRFGSSVAATADGRTLVVGAPNEDGLATNGGAAYAFESDGAGGWVQAARLSPLDLPESAQLGLTCAIDGDTLALGAPLESNEIGAFVGTVYMYERSAGGDWVFANSFLPSVAPSGAIFGSGLSVHGDRVAVGAPYIGNSFLIGSAFVFGRDPEGSWSERQRLISPLATGRDRFGASALLVGDALVFGHPRTPPPLAGMFTTWLADPNQDFASIDMYFAADATYNDRLGGALAYANGRLAVSASNHADRGAVYIYDFDPATGAASFFEKIMASDGEPLDLFGASVVMHGAWIAIGSPWDDDAGADSGAVYVFRFVPPLPGDVDGDCDVDLTDLASLLPNYGGPGPTGDLDEDGDVDLTDLATLLANFGSACV